MADEQPEQPAVSNPIMDAIHRKMQEEGLYQKILAKVREDAAKHLSEDGVLRQILPPVPCDGPPIDGDGPVKIVDS